MIGLPDAGTDAFILTEPMAAGSPSERSFGTLTTALGAIDSGASVLLLGWGASPDLSIAGGADGLARTIRLERPGSKVFALSVDREVSPDSIAEQIVSMGIPIDCDLRLQADGVYADQAGAIMSPPGGTCPPNPDGIWLITGGARGVTASCVIELARRQGGTFLLLGRSPVTPWPEWLPATTDMRTLRTSLAQSAGHRGVPARPIEIDRFARGLLSSAEISATLSSIELTGAQAFYLQADVADSNAVCAAITATLPVVSRITGLVHGAGVLADRTIEKMTRTDFDTVFSPKVDGLLSVLRALNTDALQHIGIFSSASAVFGNTGQANYAAANAWLNNAALSLGQHLPDTRVRSFCWGPWDGGMVDEALAKLFNARGIGLIAREEGARIFCDLLLSGSPGAERYVIGDEWSGE